MGTLRYGIEFHAAAVVVDETLRRKSDQPTLDPAYFLVGRAIELGLKAYLRYQRSPLKHVKYELRHDLEAALQEAEAVGLGQCIEITDATRQLIASVNALYSDKQFEYPETGFKTMPAFGPLQRFAHDLLMAVAKVIPDARNLLRSKAGQILIRLA